MYYSSRVSEVPDAFIELCINLLLFIAHRFTDTVTDSYATMPTDVHCYRVHNL